VRDGNAADDSLVGTILNRKYRIERRVGSGGFGVVYAATHLLIQEPRAIKVLRVEGMENKEEATTRFFREAKVGITLSHPGIVRVFELELWGATPYLVMELLRGQSLRERLRAAGRLDWREAFQIGIRVAEALSAAHALEVLHRDLKPDNVFLCEDRVVKLLDFGIARFASAATLTRPGTFLGTPRYMAPEQVNGARDLDGRADVYGLGMVLWACVSGRKPFAELDDEVAICAALAQGRGPGQLAALVPSLPANVAAVLAQAIEPDRERRTPDMRALKAALEACLRGVSAAATLLDTRSPLLDPPGPSWDVRLPSAPTPAGPTASSLSPTPPIATEPFGPTAGPGPSRTVARIWAVAAALVIAVILTAAWKLHARHEEPTAARAVPVPSPAETIPTTSPPVTPPPAPSSPEPAAARVEAKPVRSDKRGARARRSSAGPAAAGAPASPFEEPAWVAH
jgi:serine/threonine-protein kinase